MANIVFNIALGRGAYYGSLPAANDALIAVPIETTGIVSDTIMKDYDTLDAILAGASNEQLSMGRKTLANVTLNVDDVNNRVDVDADSPTWTAATGNAVSALVICYDPDTTAGTDADIIPIVKLDFVVTPTGTDIIGEFNAAGFYRAV